MVAATSRRSSPCKNVKGQLLHATIYQAGYRQCLLYNIFSRLRYKVYTNLFALWRFWYLQKPSFDAFRGIHILSDESFLSIW